MSHKLAVADLRHSAWQTRLNAVSIALAVTMMLTLAETTFKPPHHHVPVIFVLRAVIAAMASGSRS